MNGTFGATFHTSTQLTGATNLLCIISSKKADCLADYMVESFTHSNGSNTWTFVQGNKVIG